MLDLQNAIVLDTSPEIELDSPPGPLTEESASSAVGVQRAAVMLDSCLLKDKLVN